MCSDHEGTPMLALEALALGIPLVAHNTGGLKNILAEHQELLITNHTPQGYADGLQKLLLKTPIDIKLTEQYSATSNKNQTLVLYKSLIR
jgi:glycosyltransferase involved in cell wall biosynthesis